MLSAPQYSHDASSLLMQLTRYISVISIPFHSTASKALVILESLWDAHISSIVLLFFIFFMILCGGSDFGWFNLIFHLNSSLNFIESWE